MPLSTDGLRQASRTFDSRAWLVVLVSFLGLALIFSSRASIGLMMPIWEQDPGWSRAFVSTVSAVGLLVMAIGSPLAGNIVDRHGPRYAYAGSFLLVGIAFLATAHIGSAGLLLVSLGVVGGIGNGGMSMSIVSATVAGYFLRGRSLATGIALAGGSAGQLLIMPLIGAMLAALAWREIYLIIGLVILAMAPLAFFLFRERPPHTPPPVRIVGDGFLDRVRGLSRNSVFLTLTGAFFICGLTTSGAVDVHLLPYAASCGFPPVESTFAYGVLGVGNLVGLILFGWLADRLHAPWLLAGVFTVRAFLFLVLMAVADDLPLLVAFAAIFGLINYATLPLLAAIVARRIGVRIMGLCLGLLIGAHSLGAAAGALMGGWLYDLFARYQEMWWVAFGFCLVAALLTLSLGGPARQRAAAVPA